MPSSARSLIIGVAAGYKSQALMPFLKSLRQTGYAGRVCFFVMGMDAGSLDEIRREADDVVVLDQAYGQAATGGFARLILGASRRVRNAPRVSRLYPFLFRLPIAMTRPANRQRLRADLEQALEGLQSLRYGHYREYLLRQEPAPDFVMLSDLRDVFFQGDPFDHQMADLEVFLEADTLRIGTQALNRRWIADLYGERAAASLSDRPVSCSGTVLGTTDGILRYLGEMTAEIERRHRRPLGSHDQGIHNYLLQTGRLDPVRVNANGRGPVLTLGMEKEVRQDADGRLLNRDGSVPAVVHQYDRHAGAGARLLNRLGEPGSQAPDGR